MKKPLKWYNIFVNNEQKAEIINKACTLKKLIKKSDDFCIENSSLVLKNDFLLEVLDSLNESEFYKYLDALKEPKTKSLRVNENKISVDIFKQIFNEILTNIPFENSGFYLDSDKKYGLNALHLAGAYYLQEASSMLPVSSINVNLKNLKVLDMCASPGGKSTQILNKMQNAGLLVSNEIINSRAKILFSNIERLGYKNAIVLNEKPQNIEKHFAGFFDIVLVDAPCSGEGMFRKEPEAVCAWNLESVKANAIRQFEILKSASSCVKNNGYLIYSTCTFSHLEDEENVKKLLQSGDFELEEANKLVLPFIRVGAINKTYKFFPFLGKGEGQFFAVLKRVTPVVESKLPYAKITKIQNSLIDDFLNKTIRNSNKVCITNKNQINILPDVICNTGNLNTLCNGVILGEIVKNRIEPFHQFFSAYGTEFLIKLELEHNNEMLKKYIAGEELDAVLPSGFGTIFANGCALGGFKSVNGKLKNYYPKGLRLKI